MSVPDYVPSLWTVPATCESCADEPASLRLTFLPSGVSFAVCPTCLPDPTALAAGAGVIIERYDGV